MEKEGRIKYLVDILNKYAFHYYTLDDPLIEDSEYDVLYDELVNLEKETGIILPNSPTNRIGGEVLSGFEKHVHLNTLYSLGKAQSKEEVRNWVNKTIEFVENYNKNHVNKLPTVEFYVEFKFDGLTVNLTYDGSYYKPSENYQFNSIENKRHTIDGNSRRRSNATFIIRKLQ